MIIGEPDKFALYFDKVESWSTDLETNGISGVFMNGFLYITNYGLISMENEFEKFIENIFKEDVFSLENINLNDNRSIIIALIKKSFPNWWAYSDNEWESKINQWDESEEDKSFLFNLESFSIGNDEKYYLFGLRFKSFIKFILYIKKDGKDFFDLSSIDEGDFVVSIIDRNYMINKLKSCAFLYHISNNVSNRSSNKD